MSIDGKFEKQEKAAEDLKDVALSLAGQIKPEWAIAYALLRIADKLEFIGDQLFNIREDAEEARNDSD